MALVAIKVYLTVYAVNLLLLLATMEVTGSRGWAIATLYNI